MIIIDLNWIHALVSVITRVRKEERRNTEGRRDGGNKRHRKMEGKLREGRGSERYNRAVVYKAFLPGRKRLPGVIDIIAAMSGSLKG